MDAFESLVALLLERDGYWTATGVKVDLTKAEKRRIERPTSPRWEVDVVGYKGSANEILVVECKSYLDSRGVRFEAFDGSSEKLARRYKLFNDATLRRTVFRRLGVQLEKAGSCAPSPRIKLGLAAGKVATETDRGKLQKLFDKRGWLFFDEEWLFRGMTKLAESRYENEVATIAAKLLLRYQKPTAISVRRTKSSLIRSRR